MKAYLVNGKGIEQLSLADLDNPKITQSNHVIVEVKACSLNYRDLLVAKGLYGPANFPPFIALSDMSGVITEVGDQVRHLKIGDRVLNAPFTNWPAGKMRSDWARTFVGGNGVNGVLAEKIVYPAEALVKIPDYLSFNEASTLTIAGLTAWSALVTHGQTKPGEWVLLHGTGGVSIFAAQLAQVMGARTIMTTSSTEKAAFVKDHFKVYETFNYKDPDWFKKIKDLTGSGVDVVVDVAGGETLNQSLKICNYGARVGVIGLLDDMESKINVMSLIQHQVSLKGIFMDSTEQLHAFIKALEFSKIKPYVNKVFSFAQAKEAYHYLNSQKHLGKVVINLENIHETRI